ncbi:MAG: hypothetical protein R3C59_12495 [Planctomycetaceae bacterium]
MSTPSVTLEVVDRFDGLRRRYLVTRLGIVVSASVATFLLLWLLVAVVDFFLELPFTWLRTAMSVSVSGTVVWLVSRCVSIVRDARSKPFAGLLERSFDGFGQRIRTVLDTVSGRVRGPEEMLTALGNQTLGRWETLSPGQLVPWRRLLTATVICALTGGLAGMVYSGGSDMTIAMKRALGNDIAYTTLHVEPGNSRILEGLPVNVSLQLKGRTNRDVMLRHRVLNPESVDSDSTAPEWTETEMQNAGQQQSASRRDATFELSPGHAIQPLEYQFVTSVGSTAIYRIDVQPLIEVERIETVVQPPAYTQLQPRTFTTRDVSALERSIVTVTIQTNHPLEKAILETGPKPSKLEPVEVTTGDRPTLWAFQLPASDSLHWQFSGEGHDGTPMTAVKGRLRIHRDNAPKVTWQDPPDEISVHTLAEIPMQVNIADDYGISETGMVFQLGDDEEFVLAEWVKETTDTPTDNRTSLKLENVLPLESFALTERDFISYYAYAIDNREGALQRTESDMRYIDVRPLRQFYGEIELPPGNGDGNRSLRVTLGELIQRQRFLINRTRRLTRSNSTSLASQLGTIDRMVESQSELAGLVRFLTEFLISQGNDDVEALNQAEAAMLQAADSLAATSFDLALIQENDALLALAEARRTLDIFLIKNATPQQRQQMARFARQMRQKLRRERPKSERQLADSLKQIASQQRRLGQMASQMASQRSVQTGRGGTGTPMKNAKPSDNPSASAQSPTETNPDSNSKNSDTDPPDTTTPPSDAAPEPTDETSINEAGEKNDAQPDDNTNGQGNDGKDPQEQLYAEQVELLERIQAIEEQLAERLADSDLMTRRMAAAKAGMDELASQARNGNPSGFRGRSDEVADQLAELGAQLDALQEAEAVARISAIRDMTAALAGMENQLSQNLNGTASQNSEPRSEADSNSGSNSESETEAEASGRERLVDRIRARTETIEDVLKVPVDPGDVETSDVNDQLETFLQETEFLEQLQASRQAADALADQQNESPPPQSGSEAQQRAMEFAEASQRLDDLYQQLVTPRLARLRALEQRASQMQQASGGANGEPRDMDPETKAGLAELKDELEREGLKGLAELLDPSEVSDDEIAAMLQKMSGNMARSNTVPFAESVRSGYSGRVVLVVRRLREQIQETVLLEISADQDAPVPSQYRDLVDGYFRTLAGEDDAE